MRFPCEEREFFPSLVFYRVNLTYLATRIAVLFAVPAVGLGPRWLFKKAYSALFLGVVLRVTPA